MAKDSTPQPPSDGESTLPSSMAILPWLFKIIADKPTFPERMLYNAFPILWIISSDKASEYRKSKRVLLSYAKSCFLFIYLWLVIFLPYLTPQYAPIILEIGVFVMFVTIFATSKNVQFDQAAGYNLGMGISIHLTLIGNLSQEDWLLYFAITMMPIIVLVVKRNTPGFKVERSKNWLRGFARIMLSYAILCASIPMILKWLSMILECFSPSVSEWAKIAFTFHFGLAIASIVMLASIVLAVQNQLAKDSVSDPQDREDPTKNS